MLRSKQGGRSEIRSQDGTGAEVANQWRARAKITTQYLAGVCVMAEDGKEKIKAQALSRAKIAAKGGPRVKITSLPGLEQKSWPSIRTKQQSPPEVVPEPKNS